MLDLSVLIPVYNQWSFTSACLASLAETLPGDFFEVHVMDNASTDQTAVDCPKLGQALFPGRFFYHRFTENRNFGPASNYGAQQAKGEYLLFLNNDIVFTSNWYEPLMADFAEFTDIAATSPILLYPAQTILGHLVQHLGVFFTPLGRVGHLYENIPAASPLAGKRRFFQAITAACLLMPRQIFMQEGGFDEAFINGFEDVDLCARLRAKGYRFTVNPEARIFHHTSRTPGRKAHEADNTSYFMKKHKRPPQADLPQLLAADGFMYGLNAWQNWEARLPPQTEDELNATETDSQEQLVKTLINHPLWHNGLSRLLKNLGKADPGAAVQIHDMLLLRSPRPEPTLLLLEELPRGPSLTGEPLLLPFCKTLRCYEQVCADYLRIFADREDKAILTGYANWNEHKHVIFQNIMLPAFIRMGRLSGNARLPVHESNAYMLWKILAQDKAHHQLFSEPAPLARKESAEFSIIIPVGDPNDAFETSLRSVLAQTFAGWELLAVCLAGTDPAFLDWLQKISDQDPRVKVRLADRPAPENPAENYCLLMNDALPHTEKAFVMRLPPGDRLAPDALKTVRAHLARHPDDKIIYSDEDLLARSGALSSPWLKPRLWDRELMRAGNYLGNLAVYSRESLLAVNGWRPSFAEAGDYDLALRLLEILPDEAVHHLPLVLYHACAEKQHGPGMSAYETKALHQYLRHIKERGKLVKTSGGAVKIQYELPAGPPKATLIVDLPQPSPQAAAWLDSLLAGTDYPEAELIVICPNLEKQAADPRMRLLAMSGAYPDRINRAAAQAEGEIICLAQPGLLPASATWLREAAAFLNRPGVGILGAKLAAPSGRLSNLGYEWAEEERLDAIFQGLPASKPGYLGLAQAVRTARAIDGRMFMTKRRTFISARGFDSVMEYLAPFDYCLRLRDTLKTLVTPHICFSEDPSNAPQWPPGGVFSSLAEQKFQARWKNGEPYLPSVDIRGEESFLHWLPGHGQPFYAETLLEGDEIKLPRKTWT